MVVSGFASFTDFSSLHFKKVFSAMAVTPSGIIGHRCQPTVFPKGLFTNGGHTIWDGYRCQKGLITNGVVALSGMVTHVSPLHPSKVPLQMLVNVNFDGSTTDTSRLFL